VHLRDKHLCHVVNMPPDPVSGTVSPASRRLVNNGVRQNPIRVIVGASPLRLYGVVIDYQ